MRTSSKPHWLGISPDEPRNRSPSASGTRAERKRRAEPTSSSSFPRAGRTEGFDFRNIVDGDSGARVGETWFSAQPIGGKVQFWVNWIWVEPTYRRRGIATLTFRLLEEEAIRAGADRVGLYVHAENEGAQSLYRRLGFAPTGIRMSKKLILRP